VERVLQCDCGFEVRATDEQGLVDGIRSHAFEVHEMVLSTNEALLLAAGAAPVESIPPRANHDKEET